MHQLGGRPELLPTVTEKTTTVTITAFNGTALHNSSKATSLARRTEPATVRWWIHWSWLWRDDNILTEKSKRWRLKVVMVKRWCWFWRSRSREKDDDVDDWEGTGGRIVATTIPEMVRGRNRDGGTARTSMLVMADVGSIEKKNESDAAANGWRSKKWEQPGTVI